MSSLGQGGKRAYWGLFYEGTNSIHVSSATLNHPNHLITQKPQHLIPSHFRLGSNVQILVGGIFHSEGRSYLVDRTVKYGCPACALHSSNSGDGLHPCNAKIQCNDHSLKSFESAIPNYSWYGYNPHPMTLYLPELLGGLDEKMNRK